MIKKSKLPQQAAALKGLRGREGFSQEQLAKKIKTSRSTISRMEVGKMTIKPEVAKKLAKVLKTKPRMFD